MPYGERVGEEEVRDALEDMADLTDAGYGPSETCVCLSLYLFFVFIC